MSKCTKTRLQASLIPNFSRGERIPNRLCGVRVFAHRASACCINFDESYDHWMRTLLIRLSTLLFVACGLLQQSAGRVSKVHDQQATTDRECSSATYFVLCTCYSSTGVYHLRLRNDLYCVEWGVKLYSLTHSAARRSALARRSGAYQLQTERYLTVHCCLQEKLRGSRSTVAHQFRKSPAADNYAQPGDNTLLCRVTG